MEILPRQWAKNTGRRIHVAEGEEGGKKLNLFSSSRKQNFAKRGEKIRKRDFK